MDLSYPIRAVTPTIDGPVLQALAGTTGYLTSPQVHRIAGTGSANGVRLALNRLAHQGVVHADRRAMAVFYAANRDHLAWAAIETLATMRRELLNRLRSEFDRWRQPPIHASLFGSVARGEGDADSDIDILLVRPEGADEDESPWADHVDELRRKVRSWTGNECQAFQLDARRLAEHVAAADPLVEEWLRDSITLAGTDLKAVLRRLPKAGR